ncbi:hypothetical protein F2Q68_00007400 [Brassica cretica]|uniref:Cation efflux protein transmembrane domain-containing protein n=1 Tax=Brassica cretica TaxID=69181 RepID=A0A8S9KPY9_BRACR|nr:hypothetical protein F2Q68_00007400 [Brassica cretica]
MKVRLGCEHGSRDNAKLPRQSSTTGRATSEWRSKISNFLLMAIIVEPLSQLSLLILMMLMMMMQDLTWEMLTLSLIETVNLFCSTLLLRAIFIVVEVVGGIKANSLAILTDAAHLLSDVGAFAISLFSLWASGWKATPKQSYGFFRIEILGALVSIQMIWILAGILVYEAIVRLKNGSGQV